MKTCHRLSAAVLTCTVTGLLAASIPDQSGARRFDHVISDVPLAAAKRPNPNMIMAIDDSGSMDFELAANVAEGVFWWNRGDGRFHGRMPDDCSDYVSKGSWGGTGSLNFNGAGSYGTQSSKCSAESGVQHTWIMYAYLFPERVVRPDLPQYRCLALRRPDVQRRRHRPSCADPAARLSPQLRIQPPILQPRGDLSAVEALQRRHNELSVGDLVERRVHSRQRQHDFHVEPPGLRQHVQRLQHGLVFQLHRTGQFLEPSGGLHSSGCTRG